jgi:hypothetical protein
MALSHAPSSIYPYPSSVSQPTMPPRRSTRVADVAVGEREARSARIVAAAQHAAPALAPLPAALVLHILSLLPVDTRLRCAEVCRSWRAALEERSLWLRLDLSASGVSPKRAVTDALLHAAAARAGGELVALDLRGCTLVTSVALLAVVTANGALREFHCTGCRPSRTETHTTLLTRRNTSGVGSSPTRSGCAPASQPSRSRESCSSTARYRRVRASCHKWPASQSVHSASVHT